MVENRFKWKWLLNYSFLLLNEHVSIQVSMPLNILLFSNSFFLAKWLAKCEAYIFVKKLLLHFLIIISLKVFLIIFNQSILYQPILGIYASIFVCWNMYSWQNYVSKLQRKRWNVNQLLVKIDSDMTVR